MEVERVELERVDTVRGAVPDDVGVVTTTGSSGGAKPHSSQKPSSMLPTQPGRVHLVIGSSPMFSDQISKR